MICLGDLKSVAQGPYTTLQLHWCQDIAPLIVCEKALQCTTYPLGLEGRSQGFDRLGLV